MPITEVVRVLATAKGRGASGTESMIELVYDTDGMLTERSLFPAASGAEVVAAAPYSCMSCHVDTSSSTTWSFDRLVPETGPCAN